MIEVTGDLFSLAPTNGVLVHACNTRGAWGAGIAKQFKERFPTAFALYHAHCVTNSNLLGTALLIPPQASDSSQKWIACLFTSEDYGRRKGSPDSIVANTRTSLEDLKTQLETIRGSEGDMKGKDKPGEVWACKFNSVNFKVPWTRTKEVIEEVGLDMTVVSKD